MGLGGATRGLQSKLGWAGGGSQGPESQEEGWILGVKLSQVLNRERTGFGFCFKKIEFHAQVECKVL